MYKINELKVKYYITTGPKFERKYKDEEPFFTRYPLQQNQSHICLDLIKLIMCREINIYSVEEYRYLHPEKQGFLKITKKTFLPIVSDNITLQIQLKEPEPQEYTELVKVSNDLELKINQFKEIKKKIKEVVDEKRIDLYFLYAFAMEEKDKLDKNSIIAYHLEIAKLRGIFKSSKKSFNAIFESAKDIKLKDAIRQEPKIIHISCHGKKPENVEENDYALVLENRGRTQKLGKKEIEELLASVKEKLKNIDLVVLSSCHSEVAGKLFLKYGVKNVVYINKKFEVSNTASLDFAISFYQKLIDCQTIKNAFNNTIKELLKQERDSFKDKDNIQCCCTAHEKHDKLCYLHDKKQAEKIHRELHLKTCTCKFEEFYMHNKNCDVLIGVNNWNKCNKKKNIKINIEKIDNYYKICCGCDKGVEDLHHFGESFKFILESQDDKSGDIIIYEDNKEGKFQYNKNCHIVEDIEDYKDNFLFLIERRDKVLDIYDIIAESNPKEHFIIIYGEAGVGKFNFSKSVCIYLKERNIIHDFITLKIVRSIDIIKSQLPHKISTEEKYIFIIEIDNELQTPINLVNEILADNRLVDRDFFFFILLNTKEDKIDTKIENNQKTTKFINLKNLSEQKALQLYGELRTVYRYKKDYLNKNELKELIRLIGYSRKEMLPLLKIIEKKNKFDDVVQHVKEKNSKKESVKGELKHFIKNQGGEIIFLLYILNKGLSSSFLKLFDPEIEKVLKGKYTYQINGIWKISNSNSDIQYNDYIQMIQLDKKEKWIKKCLEIYANILFHCIQNIHKNEQQNYFKTLDIYYYYDYFYGTKGFWKTFHDEIYEECFLKDINFSKYENIIKNENINLEDTSDNIYNLFYLNIETIFKLYSEDEKIREYLEQIIIILPRLFMKKESELKNILKKCINIFDVLKNKLNSNNNNNYEDNMNDKNIKTIIEKNILRLKLFSIILEDNNDINYKNFDLLGDGGDKGMAFAYFIQGLKITNIISKLPKYEITNKSKQNRFKDYIKKAKELFDNAKKYFINNTMKSYCFYHLGNLEYEIKEYDNAEKYYISGKELEKTDEFIKGLLNLKLAKLIIENIHSKVSNKQKFEEVIQDIMNMKDIRFINAAKELQKEMEEKLLPDIVILSSNPLLRGENYNNELTNKIKACPNNQYYLLDKISCREDIKTNLIIKYNILNEDNLREAFSGKGRILIIQSDDYNEDGDILLESSIGKSYSLSKNYFTKIKKINYDILILCFINSGKLIDNLQNKIKYLITFDDSCNSIFNEIRDESLLEYNKKSIEFLEHFIVNITKNDIQHAFDQAYDTFKATFKKFCTQKSDNEYEKINYITLTVNNRMSRVKKNEYIILETGKKNIQFIPYPLLEDLPLKFSYFSDYSKDISQIIKAIMEEYDMNYLDLIERKNRSINIYLVFENDREIQVSEKLHFKVKHLVSYEIMRFLFRRHRLFNSQLFKFYKDYNCYSKNITKLLKKRNEDPSGLGVIIIKLKKKMKGHKPIPGFLYIYLLNHPISTKEIMFSITNKKKSFGDQDDSEDKSGKKKRRKKKGNTTYQKNKIKNLDGSSSNSNSNSKMSKNDFNSSSHYTKNEKIKEFEEKTFGFTVYSHEESEEDEGYLSQDD